MRHRVVYSYSPIFQRLSAALGKWYLHEGTTSTEAGRAADKASSKNSRYFANVSYHPRPFHETVQPSVLSLPVIRSTTIRVSSMAHSLIDCEPAASSAMIDLSTMKPNCSSQSRRTCERFNESWPDALPKGFLIT